MPKPPIHKLKADELRYLASHYCKHGHTYLSHYGCYEHHDERIGFFDIETSNLDADFGIMLAYCIKDSASDKIYENVLCPQDITRTTIGEEDRRVVESCVTDLLKFDKVVGYYSTKFDLPFVRTRAMITGVEFPGYGSINHTDAYYLVRNKFRLSSNRLVNACRQLLGETQKTSVEGKYWRAALRGDKKSLDYIIDHCRKDVLDLEKLYTKLIGFRKEIAKSI